MSIPVDRDLMIEHLVERDGMKAVLGRIYELACKRTLKAKNGTKAARWLRVSALLRSIIDEEIP